MTRRRVHAVDLVVDVDGVEVKASLRRQRRRGGLWNVRWRMHGTVHEKSTRTDTVEEAKRVARRIIRGEELPASSAVQAGLNASDFVRIQREYHARNARTEAGDSTFREFLGIWKSFLRVCPVKTIPEVSEHVALRYLRHLQSMSSLENRGCSKTTSKRLSVATIKKHIRHLSVAWNRIREGHHSRVGGLHPHQLVQSNPWQAIRNNIPQSQVDDEDPVQFEMHDNDLGRFLDQFKDRPVGELFIICSLWCWGRITEMTRMQWSWIKDHYVVIPRSKAKKGRGKVARLPPGVLERLESMRDPKSPYVFARWVEDVKRCAGRPTRIQQFDPARMVGQLEKLISGFAERIGRPEISHHALRRTAMEFGEEAELRQAERTSAEKLQTTIGNKRRNYTKKFGRKAFTLADGIYTNLTIALHDFPVLAIRLGCEPLEILAEREAEKHMRMLTPLGRQRVVKNTLEGGASGEDQGVA